MTLTDAWTNELELYTEWLRGGHRPPTTIKLRRYQITRMARELNIEPGDVGTQELLRWLGDASWSAETRRSFRGAARSFFSWRHTQGYAHSDPSAGLPIISAPLGRPRPASETVVNAALATLDQRIELMIRLGAYAGLRCREIALVHSRDLVEDLIGYSLTVHGKGGKIRDVPLDDTTAHKLRQLPDGWAFPGQMDGHLSASYISKLISRHLPEGVTAHMLRHRFASQTYARHGHDILGVQQLLGHASVATTQVYTATPRENLRRMVLAAAS